MSSTGQSEAKKAKGRRKITMEKMDNESNLQVTFSKRREGLFKKTSELCTLTGAEASVVVFSPGGKAHSFGHPDVNVVADRFLNPSPDPGPVYPSRRANQVQQGPNLNQEYLAHLESQIQAEKARGEELDKVRKALQKEKWGNIEGMNYEQLKKIKGAVMDFGKKLEAYVAKGVGPDEMMMQYDVVGREGAGGFTPYGTVIPYDQGAVEPGNEAQFNDGENRGT